MSNGSAAPVFVIGFFRSGTSLLYSLLNQHSKVALMYECNVWDFPETLAPVRFQRNWIERQEFFGRSLSRHRLTFGDSLRGLEHIRTPDELYRVFSEGKGGIICGEKSPAYCARLTQLARRYPEGSFILIWRDPVEVYRSVLNASRVDRYFRRRGMVSRLIFDQEKMIRQAAELARKGCRIHHVTYHELVDNTDAVCRKICEFLGIEFEKDMLDLTNADFSAVYQSPQHNHLRRGIIERQNLPSPVLRPQVHSKLQRFHARWSRLQRTEFGITSNGEAGAEPGLMERCYHNLVGAVLNAGHNVKRALFEFIPLPWLRTYRQTKAWFLGHHRDYPLTRSSVRDDVVEHWATLAAGSLFLAGVSWLDYITGPNITLAPLYLMPGALLALVINRHWGTLGAAVSSVVWTLMQVVGNPDPFPLKITLWNTAMRFVFLEIVILLLDRVRVEIASRSQSQQAK